MGKFCVLNNFLIKTIESSIHKILNVANSNQSTSLFVSVPLKIFIFSNEKPVVFLAEEFFFLKIFVQKEKFDSIVQAAQWNERERE